MITAPCAANELHVPANLLIGKELDCRIGHNSDTVGAVALKHPFYALPLIHVLASLDAHLASKKYACGVLG